MTLRGQASQASSAGDQPVQARVHMGRARVMAFKTQTGGGDDPVELVQRGEIDRADRIGGQPGHRAALHMRLVFRRHAIGGGIDRVAEILHPRLQPVEGRVGPGARRPAGGRPKTRRRGAAQEGPSGRLNALENICHEDASLLRSVQMPVTWTLVLGVRRMVPCLRMWFSTTSQICGPSVPSFTLAQPATT